MPGLFWSPQNQMEYNILHYIIHYLEACPRYFRIILQCRDSAGGPTFFSTGAFDPPLVSI